MTGNALRSGVVLAAVAVLAGAKPGSPSAPDVPAPRPAPTDTVHLDLAGATVRALDANPGLRALAERARSADHAADGSFRQRFGDVEAVAWTSRYQDAQILRPISRNLLVGGFDGLPFAQDQVHYGLTFEVPLFLGGKLRSSSHLARSKADEAGALLQGTRWQVRANVTTVYAAIQALVAVTAAYRDNVASLEETHVRLELMVEQGKRPELDLLKLTETLEEARAQLADAQADLTHASALLAALLDYPADQTFDLDPLPDHLPALSADSTDWAGMVAETSAVVAAGLRVRQATSGRHVARSEFLPKISVRGNLLEHTASSVSGTQETWELTLGASIPVFTGGRRVAAYQGAAAAERAADLALRQTRLQQEADIRGALARFHASETALAAAGRRVAAAAEAARIEGLRYDSGAGTIEDLLRARTRAAAAEASAAKSKGDVVGAAARINALAEREIVR